MPGVAFFAFALVNVQQRTAHPLRMGQVLRPETPAAAAEKRLEREKAAQQTALQPLFEVDSQLAEALANGATGRELLRFLDSQLFPHLRG